jgi:hypothetical protein
MPIALAGANIQHMGRRYSFRRSNTFYIVYILCSTNLPGEKGIKFIDRHCLSPRITRFIHPCSGASSKENMKRERSGGGHRYEHDDVLGYQKR